MKFSRSEKESLQPENEGQGRNGSRKGEPSLEYRMESRTANVGQRQDKVQLGLRAVLRGQRNASALVQKGTKTKKI